MVAAASPGSSPTTPRAVPARAGQPGQGARRAALRLPFDPPGPRMRDYVLAVKDVLRRSAARAAAPRRRRTTSSPCSRAVAAAGATPTATSRSTSRPSGPWMTRMAGEVADGVHVHPFHSMRYLERTPRPGRRGRHGRAGRSSDDVDLLIPVFIVPGDSPEERAVLARRARTQIASTGRRRTTPSSSTTSASKAPPPCSTSDSRPVTRTDWPRRSPTRCSTSTPSSARWDEIADRLIERYDGRAERVVSYLTVEDVSRRPENIGRWGEIARAVRDAPPNATIAT